MPTRKDILKGMKKAFDLENNTMEELRQGMEEAAKRAKLPQGAAVEKTVVANMSAEWVKAANVPEENDRVILYLHGGGFFSGSCATHRGFAVRISGASAARVLLVDYRLAPEHKYPAANEDALAAYRWLLSSGIPARKIVIAGDSAGGGLALMTLLSLRDAGDPLPAAAFLLSPWTDMIHFDGESYTSRAALDPLTTMKSTRILAETFIGSSTLKPQELSPISQNLKGLPPLLIQVGDHEILLSDSTRLAQRAKEAGVEVTLEVWDNMWHVFQVIAPMLPEARQAIDSIGEFVKNKVK